MPLQPPTTRADVVCGEIGSPEAERWGAPAYFSETDRAALAGLEERRIVLTRPEAWGVRVAGVDHVGLIVLPSGRRVRIRPKIDGLVLLDWLAYLGECPPVSRRLPEPGGVGPGDGADVPRLFASLFLGELEALSHGGVPADYAPRPSESSTVRGRVRFGDLAGRLHRLPRVPQTCRDRTPDTPANRLLAAALDRVPLLLPQPAGAARRRLASLRVAWSAVPRPRGDWGGVIAEGRRMCPAAHRPAAGLAAVVLAGCVPRLGGTAGGGAFLLPLARLWEKALRRLCETLSPVTGWSPVPAAQRTRRWRDRRPGPAGETARGGGGPEGDRRATPDEARWMTADAILESNGRRWVLDAKYKRDFGDEDRTDRFQACAYAVAFAAGRVSLVYPTAPGPTARSRVLLRTRAGGKPILIDSIDLPMAAGPQACWEAMRGEGNTE